MGMTVVAPMLVMKLRAEARAMLFRLGEFETIEEAIAPLHRYALASGIVDDLGAAATQAIIDEAFAQQQEPASEPDGDC